VKCKKTGFTQLEIKISNCGSNRRSKRFLTGFTIVELLTVTAIIAMLIALLLPALAVVRNKAKEVKQRAQLTTIELTLTAFRNDYGSFPPSGRRTIEGDLYYTGAQRLAEALVGWDLLGFHPDSEWMADGKSKDDTKEIYPKPLDPTDADDIKNLEERRGPYLERASANAFKLSQLFNDTGVKIAPDTYVLCDVFGVRRVTIAGETVKAGTPILYYRANTSSKDHMTGHSYKNRIYNVYDNQRLVFLKTLTLDGKEGKDHRLADTSDGFEFFYEYITDPKVIATPWPYRADSYILITAGADGEYGTSDDICNF